MGPEARQTETTRWRVGAALGTVYLVWGSTYLAIRFAVETLPPLLMAGVRYTLAGSVLYAFLRLRGAPPPARRDWLPAAFVGLLMVTVGNGALSWAEVTVPSGTAALLVASMPVWMVLLDWLAFGGRRPRAAVGLGLLAGIAGVALLLGSGHGGGAAADAHRRVLGGLVVLVGSMGWAFGSLWSRDVPLPSPPLLGTALQMLCGGIVLTLVGLAAGEASVLAARPPSLRSLAGLAYLIVLGSLVAYTAYMWVLRHASASLVSTYAYVNPVVAVFLGWLIAGETLSARTLLAAAVIVAAVAVIITFRRPRPPRGPEGGGATSPGRGGPGTGRSGEPRPAPSGAP